MVDPEETFGDYDNFSVTMTPDNLIQMSHDVGFECGDACPHISWKSYDLEFNDILKLDMGQLSVGDLGYRTPNEYEPLPKDFHGPPDYLDEMRIDDIEELEGEFEVYHIIEAESATMMLATIPYYTWGLIEKIKFGWDYWNYSRQSEIRKIIKRFGGFSPDYTWQNDSDTLPLFDSNYQPTNAL